MNTYKQQFDKLTEAYIKGIVHPYSDCACFVGNLLGNGVWAHFRDAGSCVGDASMNGFSYLFPSDTVGYTVREIISLENVFLKTINKETVGDTFYAGHSEKHANYENALFLAFEKTLELLKEIHIKRGETIDETPTFTKRQLQTV